MASKSKTPSLKSITRSNSLLDHLGACVFVVDKDLKIVFANKRAVETLRSIEDALSKSLGLRADQIVGANLSRFGGDEKAKNFIALGECVIP